MGNYYTNTISTQAEKESYIKRPNRNLQTKSSWYVHGLFRISGLKGEKGRKTPMFKELFLLLSRKTFHLLCREKFHKDTGTSRMPALAHEHSNIDHKMPTSCGLTYAALATWILYSSTPPNPLDLATHPSEFTCVITVPDNSSVAPSSQPGCPPLSGFTPTTQFPPSITIVCSLPEKFEGGKTDFYKVSFI